MVAGMCAGHWLRVDISGSAYRGYWGYIGGYIGIMENKMETTGIIGVI